MKLIKVIKQALVLILLFLVFIYSMKFTLIEFISYINIPDIIYIYYLSVFISFSLIKFIFDKYFERFKKTPEFIPLKWSKILDHWFSTSITVALTGCGLSIGNFSPMKQINDLEINILFINIAGFIFVGWFIAFFLIGTYYYFTGEINNEANNLNQI